jgi:tellurite resistance protein TehA-like permease
VVPRALRQRGPAAAPRPRARPARRDVQATWLLPVVPPLVSAATGAGLIAHLPTAATRGALLVACYLLFTLSLTASSALIVALLARLRRDGLPQAPLVPTLWIVLGPLGQSITAVTLLGAAATHAGLPHAAALRGFAIAYGVPVLVLALVWLAVVASITARTARRGGLPFTLTWWSFTFPVGTCVTGASELALHTGVGALAVLAAVLFAGLVAAWATTAARTARWLLSPRAAPTSPATPSPARLAPRPAR